MNARATLSWKDAAGAFGCRGFGRREDLDVDFAAWPRSEQATQVLARCLEPGPAGGEARALALTLAGRTGVLLAVHALSCRSADLPVPARCSPGCGAAFEVVLPLAPLLDLAQQAERERELELSLPGTGVLRLRRPTGEDQRRWQAATYGSIEEARRAMLRSLAVGGGPPPTEYDATALDAAMEEADPLPGLSVAARCPECGAEATRPLDLERVLLDLLALRQRALLREVHVLASHYGWSETEVCELPEWRRREYLRFIEAAPGRHLPGSRPGRGDGERVS